MAMTKTETPIYGADAVHAVGRLLGIRGAFRIYRLPMVGASFAVVNGSTVRLASTLRDAVEMAR